MSNEQEQWAAQIREIPIIFHKALLNNDDAIRHRPAPSEWSAIEVIGHMIDKIQNSISRVRLIMAEERPVVVRYDQDALVLHHGYQHADPEALLEQLRQECEHFAALIEHIPPLAVQREGVHEAYGPMTVRQCIEDPLGSASEHLEQLRVAQTLI